MAEIRPFRGLVYDTSKIKPTVALSPPYDVINDEQRGALEALDDKNSVRLILPQGEGDTKYGKAAELLRSWCEDGTLRRSDRPAIYRYHQIFPHPEEPERTIVRRGVIAGVRLHAFDERVILPHERTLKGPKIDRLKLMTATDAHFSQIFTLYSDPSGESDRIFEKVELSEPTLEGTTADGTRHRLWEVTDRELVGAYRKLMSAHKLYIADGHHRYETMLALREQYRQAAGGELPSDSDAEFGTLFIANMDDSGMIVLPTHRLIHSLGSFDKDEFLRRVGEVFNVREVELDAEEVRANLRGCMTPAVVAAFPDKSAFLLSLKADFDRAGAGLKGVLGELDVSVLHGVILESILGIDRAAQEAKSNIYYLKDTGAAVEAIKAGEGQVCFLMRATPLEQVKDCSDAGEFMPQKSTFFYPKIASGIVIRTIDPDAGLD
jgi:uncharacterized protein (DUF1015 family)